MISKLLKGSGIALACLITLIAIILMALRFSAHARETEVGTKIAPKTGRYVQAHDVRIFIQEAGPTRATPVIFIHGMGAWSEIWREMMRATAGKGYRAIAIDLPPFGFSQRPTLLAFSSRIQAKRILALGRALGNKRFVLVGHSFGGGPTLHAALNGHESLAGLVLVDIAAQTHKPDQPTSAPRAVSSLFAFEFMRNGIISATFTNPSMTRTLFASFVHDKKAITEARVAMLQKPMVIRNTTPYFASWLKGFITEQDFTLAVDFSKKSNELKIPQLIIWGDQDTVTPLKNGRLLAKHLPRAELRIMEGAGHIPQIENTKKFNEILVRFLETNVEQ